MLFLASLVSSSRISAWISTLLCGKVLDFLRRQAQGLGLERHIYLQSSLTQFLLWLWGSFRLRLRLWLSLLLLFSLFAAVRIFHFFVLLCFGSSRLGGSSSSSRLLGQHF